MKLAKALYNDFKAHSQPLFNNAMALLRRFYSPEVLAADSARVQWQEPDLKNLPSSIKNAAA